LPKFDQSEGKEGERRYFLFQLRTLFPSVDKMANECSAITAEHTGSELTSFAVELVFREYLNNIIEHGLGMRKDSAITIELTILKMEIVIRFIDYGVDWEFPLEFIENSYDQNIVSEKTRGRGMMMIRTQVTELKRERFENTNVTRFVIPIQSG
jgi:anti-sigma regulatory factor (Ser/Thr protein kinase)